MKNITLLTFVCGLTFAANTFANDIVFQFKQIQPEIKKQLEQSVSSNEYWLTVTGKELQNGIDLPLSASNSFVRVAPKLIEKNDTKTYIEPLNVNALTLLPKDGVMTKGTFAEQVFAQKEMNDAGFSDGSVALKVKSNKALQTLLLQTKQYLPDDARYLVHVKEKDSHAILNVNAPNELSNEANGFELTSLAFTDQNIKVTGISARLKSPTQRIIDVGITNNLISFNEQLAYVGAINGLYEIELQVEGTLANSPIKRSIKIPFVNVKQTAKIDANYSFTELANRINASVPLTVNEPGKFSIQATLQGSNDGKYFNAIATVEMAKMFNSDGNFSIPFNVKSRYREYRLTNVVLKDHSRLLVLNTPKAL